MSFPAPAAEALEIWREAERLLAELPRVSPDHETATIAVTMSRDAYHRLTNAAEDAADHLEVAHRQIEAVRALLREVRARRGL